MIRTARRAQGRVVHLTRPNHRGEWESECGRLTFGWFDGRPYAWGQREGMGESSAVYDATDHPICADCLREFRADVAQVEVWQEVTR